MISSTLRTIAVAIALVCAACAFETGPPGVPSSTNVNPITGTQGGSGAAH